MYTELLKLCGYEEEEIERERPRIDRAFNRLEIGAEDIRRGERRVRELYDIELEGVRQLLGFWMRELLDLVLAKDEGKKVIYGCYPPTRQIWMALMNASQELYVGIPEMIIDTVMGGIFDKLNPILEAGEESGLAPGLAHCSLLQARLGAIVKGMIPMPDLLLNFSYLCDQSPKVDELIHELYEVPVVYVDTCWGQNWGDYPNVKDRRVEYLGARINMALREVEQILGCQITEESEHIATVENAKLWFNYQSLIEFVAGCDPQPLSQVDQGLIINLAVGCPTRRTAESNRAISTLMREAKERCEQGRGVVTKGAPRVIWYAPSVVSPETLQMVEGMGLAVPLVAAAWLSPLQRSKVQHRTFAERIAEGVVRDDLPYGSEGYVEHFKEVCRRWRPDGVINAYFFSCRAYAIPPLIVRKAIQDELNIPVLTLEWDVGDKREYGVEQLRTRIEAFAEVLKAAKASWK